MEPTRGLHISRHINRSYQTLGQVILPDPTSGWGLTKIKLHSGQMDSSKFINHVIIPHCYVDPYLFQVHAKISQCEKNSRVQ